MSLASMSSWRSQPAVAGLVDTIQVKLKGVRTSASTAATAEMLTLSAVLPRPRCVTTLLKLPPGQQATRIMAASMLGGRSSSSVATHVAPGSRMNCGIWPMSTRRGACATRRKSSRRSSRATENTMVASTRLRISCCVLIQPKASGRPGP